MTRDDQIIEATLDNLLRLWHEWSRTEGLGQGYPAVSTSCKFYQTSRQHDDRNGAWEADVDSTLAEAIDSQIAQIPDPWRNALAINARNLATGRAVWRSARLPQDDMARAVIVLEARTKLMQRLYAAGLM